MLKVACKAYNRPASIELLVCLLHSSSSCQFTQTERLTR